MKRSVLASLSLAAFAALAFGYTSMTAAGTVISGSVKSGSAVAPDTIVYIEHAAGTFTPSATPQMDQRNMKFTPYVLPILEGTTVKFLNSDLPSTTFSRPITKSTTLVRGPRARQRITCSASARKHRAPTSSCAASIPRWRRTSSSCRIRISQ